MDAATYAGKGRNGSSELQDPQPPYQLHIMPGGEMHKTFKIFCGNLAGSATKDDLYYLFSKYGPVVEAVVMVGKYYGFVHMAFEEDGWKAICELRGYNLHGKAMAVEASINAKKATPIYKHNIIGKGVSTLDDFNDYANSKAKALAALAEARERQTPTTYLDSPPPPIPNTAYPFPPPYHQPSSSSVPPHSPLGHTPPPQQHHHHQPPPLQQQHQQTNLAEYKMPNVDANSNPIHEVKHENMPAICSTCGNAFDEWQHKPKILSCGHTFCCDCLRSLARDTEVKCPVGCAFSTALTPAGISGLTTNYTVPMITGGGINGPTQQSLPGLPPSSYVIINGAHRSENSPIPSMVCCTCLKMADGETCAAQGHQLIPEGPARDILQTHLRTAQDVTLKQLRQTMTMRAAMKERLERTLQSVEKFLEELRRKVEGEQLEEAVLQEHLADLTAAGGDALIDCPPITHLIESLNKVQYYSSIIQHQFTQCAAMSAINNATESIVIKLKPPALETVLSNMGFRAEEAFQMQSSLEEHALYGNNANVLLLYMLSDLLSTRMIPPNPTPVSPISPSHQQPPTLVANMPLPQTLMPASPVSTLPSVPSLPPPPPHLPMPVTEESIARSLSITPDLKNHELGLKAHDLGLTNHDLGLTNHDLGLNNHHDLGLNNHNLGIKNQEISHINVEHILQMTEAIEAGSLLAANDGITSSPSATNSVSSALSLGLSNLSLLAAEPTENGKEEMEPLLIEKKESNPVSYVDAAKKPAKPLPPAPDTPPKVNLSKPSPHAIRPGKFPHCWMVLSIDSEVAGRIIFELRPDKAPRMCENFVALCTGRNGYGYKGTHFFKSGEGFLAGGDVENDDGSGGYSAFDKNTFEADLCPLKDEVGMVRFKGIGTSDKGRGMVGSQFMIWCGDRDFKKFSYSLVFGKVVDGLDVAKKAAAINVHRISVKIQECGAI